ncbi:hypothetical protein F5884DRAFT_393418 [Xylogone sp. PMI_703]|nr:hypothetical protein F5884DRAFT_393418 [Xylogone sp. PMI_703]
MCAWLASPPAQPLITLDSKAANSRFTRSWEILPPLVCVCWSGLKSISAPAIFANINLLTLHFRCSSNLQFLIFHALLCLLLDRSASNISLTPNQADRVRLQLGVSTQLRLEAGTLTADPTIGDAWPHLVVPSGDAGHQQARPSLYLGRSLSTRACVVLRRATYCTAFREYAVALAQLESKKRRAPPSTLL